MKFVINNCFGEFNLSEEAFEWLIENKGWKATTSRIPNKDNVKKSQLVLVGGRDKYMFNEDYWQSNLHLRSDKDLVACVETLGEEANSEFSKLKVVDSGKTPRKKLEIVNTKGLETLQVVPKRFN